MFGRWSTINDQGELEFLQPNEPNYSYDRMSEIENYTNYYFSPVTKAETLAQEVQIEAEKDWRNVESVFSNAAAGIQNSAQVFRYLPFLALVAAGYFVYKKAA